MTEYTEASETGPERKPLSGKLGAIAVLVVIAALAGAVFVLYQGQHSAPHSAVSSDDEYLLDDIVASLTGTVGVSGGIIRVSAPIEGVIVDVLAAQGDVVEVGQILARQDDRVERIAITDAVAQLDLLSARIAANRTRLDRQKLELERLVPLVDLGAATQRELEQAQEQVISAEISAKSETIQLAQAQTRVENARLQAELRVIRSPVKGRIASIRARPGSASSSSSNEPLFVIIPDAPMVVHGKLNLTDRDAVKLGQTAQVFSALDSGTAHEAEIVQIADYISLEDNTQLNNDDYSAPTLDLVLELRNQDLLIGQRVNINILADKSGN